ncbi:aminotransferase class I/II-fold pyridoxal phosphate-dependent enzyme [Vibrio europaeus]|uniref:aminotransferase class I/II-fold pyridoxal phosphate-dependent enzyme n=1 Tax=Vibrio europaeus TaxID=300876 RepID=UPI0039E0673E
MQVLIPAAGMGSRLGRYTSEKTKCMVEVNGKTLVERALDTLANYNIDRFIFVVGYQKDKLVELLGDSYKGIPIKYIHNDKYYETNNIYSIYLAKDILAEDDTILIESDLIFEEEIIKKVITNPYPNLAVVDRYRRWMDGTVVTIDESYDILDFISGRKFNYDDAGKYYKTVNIYKFSKEFLINKYIPFLEAYSIALGKNEYYEQVLKIVNLLETKDLKAFPLNGEKWYEIDDAQDLDNAQVIFSDREKKSTDLTKRYGGYWRFDGLVDFCYLVNPYFPTNKMLDEFKYSFDVLLREYPSGARVQSLLAAKLFNCNENQIVVGNGAAELIDALANQIHIKLGLFLPTFEEYSSRFKNCKIGKIENKDYSYNADDIIDFCKDTEGFILVNPDNPSGNYIKYHDLLKIVDWFDKNNKILIVDESFVDFSEEGIDASLLSSEQLEKSPNLIVIKSISKSYGVPGARLGVLASSNTDLIKRISSLIPVWNINSFGEYFLQIIGKYTKEYKTACVKISKERERFYSRLLTIPFLRPIPSQSNYILCQVVGMESAQLVENLAYSHDLLIKDCSKKVAFEGKQYVRIAIKDSYDNQRLIDALEALV